MMNLSNGIQNQRRRHRRWATVVAGASLVAMCWTSAPAFAAFMTPTDDVRDAYRQALEQLDELNIDGAISTLDVAITQAQAQGMAFDPALAPVYALRASMVYASAEDPDDTAVSDAVGTMLETAVRLDYYVQIPIELRSTKLQTILDDVRAQAKPPVGAVTHEPPIYEEDQDLVFRARFNVSLPRGGSLVMYWRFIGETGEYRADYMEPFGNLGLLTFTAEQHENRGIEYFFYAFNEEQQTLTNLGTKDDPLRLPSPGSPVVVAEPEASEQDETKRDRRKARGTDRSDRFRGPTNLPRVFIHVGIGTGVGIAHGSAELTYEQYDPGVVGGVYGNEERACAIERWYAGEGSLASSPAVFQEHLSELDRQISNVPTDLANSYNASFCARRHPISTGLALAPLHVSPEIGVRVGHRVVLSVFARLQVVTGSKVFTDDPSKSFVQSYEEDVRSQQPPGTKARLRNPPFTYAIGVKAKYYFGREEAKFRLFAGGFAGFGWARLRIPMGFSNDRNGNSVPDGRESAVHGLLNDNGEIIANTCIPVWPYEAGCQQDAAGEEDRALALTVAQNTPDTDERVDTVAIGPGFIGATFGVQYQVIEHFGLWAEVDAGVWFPNASSGLFDLTLGPVLTF